jgi:hypothetical protein
MCLMGDFVKAKGFVAGYHFAAGPGSKTEPAKLRTILRRPVRPSP